MFRFGDPGGRIYTAVGASNVNLLAHWTGFSSGGGGSLAVSAGNGRHDGGSCLRFALTGSAVNINLSKTLDAQPTWGVAFGFKVSALPVAAGAFLAFYDGATLQVDLRLNADGTFTLTRNGTTLATTTSSISVGTWYHLELKVTFHASAGAYELRVNSTSAGWIPPATGKNTSASTVAQATAVKIGWGISASPNSGVVNEDFDDLIVYDQQTTDANGFSDIHDFVGDRALYWLLPTGAGTTTQWTPDSGSNYARVNEATPDGDTSYVSDSTVGHVDTYAMADLPGHVANVQALATVHYARKDDVGARGMKSELRSAGANATHATEIALATGYVYYFQSWGQDPNAGTPAAWTVAAVNALEMGQDLSS